MRLVPARVEAAQASRPATSAPGALRSATCCRRHRTQASVGASSPTSLLSSQPFLTLVPSDGLHVAPAQHPLTSPSEGQEQNRNKLSRCIAHRFEAVLKEGSDTPGGRARATYLQGFTLPGGHLCPCRSTTSRSPSTSACWATSPTSSTRPS